MPRKMMTREIQLKAFELWCTQDLTLAQIGQRIGFDGKTVGRIVHEIAGVAAGERLPPTNPFPSWAEVQNSPCPGVSPSPFYAVPRAKSSESK